MFVQSPLPSNGDSIQFACAHWSRPVAVSDILTKTHIVCGLRTKIRAVAKIYELTYPMTSSTHVLFTTTIFWGQCCWPGCEGLVGWVYLLKSFVRACGWLYFFFENISVSILSDSGSQTLCLNVDTSWTDFEGLDVMDHVINRFVRVCWSVHKLPVFFVQHSAFLVWSQPIYIVCHILNSVFPMYDLIYLVMRYV